MPADTIGESTFCCGGGGGLLTDDLVELRVKGALPRMQALQQVMDEYGAVAGLVFMQVTAPGSVQRALGVLFG